mmetsp:Transcript_60766/g.195779  ORF Transcript_60766/g.195779 Transcript_60766/m.195779 type:complete len:254 (+) Transcript_60766:2224-2985(+)
MSSAVTPGVGAWNSACRAHASCISWQACQASASLVSVPSAIWPWNLTLRLRRPTGAFNLAPRPMKSPLCSNFKALVSFTAAPLTFATVTTSESEGSGDVEPMTSSSPGCQSTSELRVRSIVPAAAVFARYCQDDFGAPCTSRRPVASTTMPLRSKSSAEAPGLNLPTSCTSNLPRKASEAPPSQPTQSSPLTRMVEAAIVRSTPASRAITRRTPWLTVNVLKFMAGAAPPPPRMQSLATMPSDARLHASVTEL